MIVYVHMENYLRRCLESSIVGDELKPLLEVLMINDCGRSRPSEIGCECDNKRLIIYRATEEYVFIGSFSSRVHRSI